MKTDHSWVLLVFIQLLFEKPTENQSTLSWSLDVEKSSRNCQPCTWWARLLCDNSYAPSRRCIDHPNINKEFFVSLLWDMNTTSTNNCIKLYSLDQQCMAFILTFYPAVISSSFNPVDFIESLGRYLPLTRSEKLNCSHNLLSSKTTRQIHTSLSQW